MRYGMGIDFANHARRVSDLEGEHRVGQRVASNQNGTIRPRPVSNADGLRRQTSNSKPQGMPVMLEHTNEKIQHCWNVALDILQPSIQDIEHGLALHRDALVFEAYSLGLAAALENDLLAALIESGAPREEVIERRIEMGMTRKATDPVERNEFVEAWDASGVTCLFQNAGRYGRLSGAISWLAHNVFCADLMRDFCPKAVTPADIVAAKREGRHCFYMSLNGVPLPEKWESAEAELEYIRFFFQLGARQMHLTYNRRNMIGDGCAEVSNAGLSDFGRAVVAEMNRVGVIVDVAHSGWQTSLEAAQVSEKPIVASHSACCAVHSHPRGKPDNAIRAICDSGGYIGICCIPVFLGGSGDISAFLDHIDHVARTFGTDHVAIGTDVTYRSRNTDTNPASSPPMPRGRAKWDAFWPDHVPVSGPEWGQPRQVDSMAFTNWPIFTVGLVQRGYSDTDIRKILGGNVMRVARAVLPGWM